MTDAYDHELQIKWAVDKRCLTGLGLQDVARWHLSCVFETMLWIGEDGLHLRFCLCAVPIELAWLLSCTVGEAFGAAGVVETGH